MVHWVRAARAEALSALHRVVMRIPRMQSKEEYLAKLKAQLDEWETDLGHLREKAADASDDVKEKAHQQIAELKAKWDEGAARRQEVMDAADDHWEGVKDDIEEKWAELKTGVQSSIDRIKSMFG
jgi:hypothetical protein